jgi:hypothetical protein
VRAEVSLPPLHALSPTPSDDLADLNSAAISPKDWSGSGPEAWEAIEARVRREVQAADDFVTIPFPRLAAASDAQIAAAAEGYRKQAAIRDARLSRTLTVQERAIPLADLCDQLREKSGVQLAAGQSIAEEKVSLFCRDTPLRDLMRRLGRPFGYTWLRSTRDGALRYELVQDLRSQLLEEEIRNRDRQEALLALDQVMQEYRDTLGLSPEEIRQRMERADPAEKKRLEMLAGVGWGLVQVYHRLSPQELAALRAGSALTYTPEPQKSELPLPKEVAAGVAQSLAHRRILIMEGGVQWGTPADLPHGVPPSQVPELKPGLNLQLVEAEPGHFALTGGAQVSLDRGSDSFRLGSHLGRPPEAASYLAVGMSPSTRRPDNRAMNKALARDPSLQRRISVQPRHLCPGGGHAVDADRVTSADVLAALHEATSLPIVADAYTRLYPLAELTARDLPLFDALNRLADGMTMRWRWDGGWLQLRSAAYFHDRLKEVPRQKLARWASVRRRHGWLPLPELFEIAALSDAQLDAREMAEGARRCFGLVEWDAVRNRDLRPHLRFLADLHAEQRDAVFQPEGLVMRRLSLPRQQTFLRLALGDGEVHPETSLEALSRSTLRAGYRALGGFHCSGGGNQLPMPARMLRLLTVSGRTREATLAAARRFDPAFSEEAIEPTREVGLLVFYTVGSEDALTAQRSITTSGQSFATP